MCLPHNMRGQRLNNVVVATRPELRHARAELMPEHARHMPLVALQVRGRLRYGHPAMVSRSRGNSSRTVGVAGLLRALPRYCAAWCCALSV